MVNKRSFYRNTKTCLIPRISHFEWIWFSMFPFSETFSHAADVTLLFNTKEIINNHYPACIHNANFSVTWWSKSFDFLSILKNVDGKVKMDGPCGLDSVVQGPKVEGHVWNWTIFESGRSWYPNRPPQHFLTMYFLATQLLVQLPVVWPSKLTQDESHLLERSSTIIFFSCTLDQILQNRQ